MLLKLIFNNLSLISISSPPVDTSVEVGVASVVRKLKSYFWYSFNISGIPSITVQFLVQLKVFMRKQIGILLLSFNILVKLKVSYFDFSWDFDDPFFKKFVDVVEDLNDTFGLGLLADFIPIFKHIPTPSERKIRKLNKFIKDFLLECMEEHRKTFDPGKNMLNKPLHIFIKFLSFGLPSMASPKIGSL